MAKQLVNPIERHVEKVVVAISAAALLGAAALFLISSPNKTELGGALVTAATIDDAVARHAEEIRAAVSSHRPKSVIPEPLADEFAAAIKQPPASAYVAVAPIRPTVPLLDPPITKVADFVLVKVIAPEKPAITSGRSTVILSSPSGDEVFRPRDWATISAVFDRKAQSELQKRSYGASNGVVYIAPPEIQRRPQRLDGTWSDDDWVLVVPTPAGPPVEVPTVEIVEGDEGPTVSPDQKKELEHVMVQLSSTDPQRDRLRPMFYKVGNGDDWSFPIITTYMDVMKQDDEILNPNLPPSNDLEDIYGLLDAGAGKEQAVERLTPAQKVAADMKRGKEMLARAKKNRSKFDARTAGNIFFDVVQNSAANAAQQNEAKKLQDEAELLVTQFQREEMTRGVITSTTGKDSAGSGGPARSLLPTQQLWAHDAAEASIEGGQTYQYRMRFRIYNLFAGEPGKFENPEDAARVFVSSDWSPATDAVSFERWEAFFVTSDDKQKKQAGVEFFRWFFGAWVKSRRHKFGIGDSVAITQRTEVPNLLDPGESDNVEVDYSAGAAVLDVDFSRAFRERRRGKGSGGVRFAAPRAETALVLVDRDGHLSERIVPRDKDDPARRLLTEKLYKGSR